LKTITKQQAQRFLLLKQGLLGKKKFMGKQGVYDYIRQAGCIQYDPIDVCGKNAELVLQSRVKGFKKSDLDELLYQDRTLVDYYDKVMSIFPIEDWPFFHRIRQERKVNGRSKEKVSTLRDEIHALIASVGPVCSRELEKTEKVDWHWASTNLGRATLETMYFDGELIIHHRKNTMKYYDLSEKYIKASVLSSPDPFETELEFIKWRLLRRISSVGFLWNKPSDAFIFIDMDASSRTQAFRQLTQEGLLSTFHIDDRPEPFYFLSTDLPILELALSDEVFTPRMEFLAPLDNMLWDRKLISYLFDFSYTWEIYTPEVKRKYGYYVLPILQGTSLIGRIEVLNIKKTKTLEVKHIWLQKDVRNTKKLQAELGKTLLRFMEFNQMNNLVFTLDTIKSIKE
jgi:uncharacterized protein YcaQ